jgi:hypothetical protein
LGSAALIAVPFEKFVHRPVLGRCYKEGLVANGADMSKGIVLMGLLSLLAGCSRLLESDEDRQARDLISKHDVDSSVNREWLQKDVKVGLELRKLLPPKGSADAFVKSLGPSKPEDHTDLGFGLTAATHTLVGGHVSCWIRVASIADEFVSVDANCPTTSKDWSKIAPIVQEALGPEFVAKGDGYGASMNAHYPFPESKAKLQSALAKELGPTQTLDVPEELQKSYEILASPLDRLVVGTACGVAGSPPLGAKETLMLEKAGRLDLLRNVLRGPNPEGRVYAAQALRRHQPLTPDDASVIEKIRTQPTIIFGCSGCMPMNAPAAQVLGDK